MARKILLADDSVTAQNMGRKILADAGYDVITVNNGSAALKRIAEVKPDLIVLDVYMPGYSGLEVCQRLKDAGETAHIPVLLTVGKLEPFKPEEARRVRADGHIVKPFEASELLTAITRLEDRMVPQQSEGGRFGTSVSGVERFGGEGNGRNADSDTDADTGWKSRLRFPSKKKKEEPESESEDAAAGATFRDFRKTKGKTGAAGVFAVKAPAPPGQEPGLVPDIPRDITPDELDALSAFAAKLDGPIPAAENIVPLAGETQADKTVADKTTSDKTTDKAMQAGPVEAATSEAAAEATAMAKAAAESLAIAAEEQQKKENTNTEEKKEVETAAPAAIVETAPAAVEATTPAVEDRNEDKKNTVEIPVEHVELPAEGAAAVAGPVVVETEPHQTEHPQTETSAAETSAAQPSDTRPSETTHPETPAAVVAVAVNTALLAQEPAPVDRTDEPRFASIAEDKIETEDKTEPKVPEAVAQSNLTEASAPKQAIAATDLENQPEESKAQELKSEEVKVETAPPVQIAAEAEEPAPSDAELAQALRLLTPATAHVDLSTVPSHGTLVAAGQLLAEEAVRNAASGPRWVAQPVALSPEEAATSLEAEMFHAFMTVPPARPGGQIEPLRPTGVSAIAAAVENRLAALEVAAGANGLPEPAAAHSLADRGSADDGSAHHAAADDASEAPVVEVPAAVIKAVSDREDAPVEGNAREKIESGKIGPDKIAAAKIEPENVSAEKITADKVDAELKVFAKVAQAAGTEEAAAAVTSELSKVEATAERDVEPVSETTAAEEEDQNSSSDAGGQESMGKDIKKSGKSNWHQIRTAPGGAAAGADVVEAAKQAEHGAEEPPKAMAAAAAEGSSASTADASTIAGIVDSIMADLRPKIVEEIAKKLAGK